MKQKLYGLIIAVAVLLLALCVCAVPAAAATTSVDVLRIANDGTTLIKESVTIEQMKTEFPIQGDGKTLYTHQGPIFEGAWETAVKKDPDYAGLPYDPYDPLEKINWEDGLAAYRGTSVKNLASVVGGIPDDAIKVILRASDGFDRKFSASYINNPEPRMGPMVLCWERNGSTTDTDLLRMYFFADDHVFGATDMLMTMPVKDQYNYSAVYPSARGLSVQNVKQIRIYTNEDSSNTPVKTYNITATSTTGGNASASLASAVEGRIVILTAVPDSAYNFKEWQVVSGGVTIPGNMFTMPACDVEINAIFEKVVASAKKNAAKIKQTTPETLPTLTVPLFTNPKSGKSIPLDDDVVVNTVIGGVEQTLPAKIIDSHVVLDNPETADDAAGLTVTFIGKKLGDSDGDGQVTVNDAVRVAQSLVSIVKLNEKGEFYGDADSDGQVTVNDAVKVAQRLVDLVDENYE